LQGQTEKKYPWIIEQSAKINRLQTQSNAKHYKRKNRTDQHIKHIFKSFFFGVSELAAIFATITLCFDKSSDFHPTLSSTQTPSLVFQDTERWYSHRCKDVNRVLGVYFWTGCACATGLFFIHVPTRHGPPPISSCSLRMAKSQF
jgi:hypothetical protein